MMVILCAFVAGACMVEGMYGRTVATVCLRFGLAMALVLLAVELQ